MIKSIEIEIVDAKVVDKSHSFLELSNALQKEIYSATQKSLVSYLNENNVLISVKNIAKNKFVIYVQKENSLELNNVIQGFKNNFTWIISKQSSVFHVGTILKSTTDSKQRVVLSR